MPDAGLAHYLSVFAHLHCYGTTKKGAAPHMPILLLGDNPTIRQMTIENVHYLTAGSYLYLPAEVQYAPALSTLAWHREHKYKA